MFPFITDTNDELYFVMYIFRKLWVVKIFVIL